MTQEEEQEYTEQINSLHTKLTERNERIAFYQDKIKNVGYDEIDECIEQLEQLKKESNLDRELSEDIQNMLEVENFLECGAGRAFDHEY